MEAMEAMKMAMKMVKKLIERKIMKMKIIMMITTPDLQVYVRVRIVETWVGL